MDALTAFWQESEIFRHYVYAVGIFIVFLITGSLLSKYILVLVTKLTGWTKTKWDDDFITAFKNPLKFLFVITGLFLAFNYAPFKNHTEETVLITYKSAIALCLGWGLFNFSGAFGHIFHLFYRKGHIKFDQIAVPFLTNIMKIIIVALTFSIVMGLWGYPITGLVTGLGLGGLAVALAAKDTLGNLIGGVVLITETPFTIGDWIQTPSVEGVVEDISFRSTKVRTFAQALVTVPNQTLANEAITNWSQMGKRRISGYIDLNIHTPAGKIKACVTDIEHYLMGLETFDKETLFVKFYETTTTAQRVLIYCFTNSTAWGDWLQSKEDLNMAVLAILDKHDVSLAVPAREVFIEQDTKSGETSED